MGVSADNNKNHELKICCIIPVYNNAETIADVITAVIKHSLPCIVVNDGSSDNTFNVLNRLKSESIRIINFDKNSGKGAAVAAAMELAFREGFTHAVQVDADGQHDLNDLPAFLEACKREPAALICGQPVFDKDVPLARLYGRKLSIWLSRLETLSTDIADILYGFRVYPLDTATEVIKQYNIGGYMEFDTAIAIRLYWLGVPIRNIKTKVSYPEGGVSHFRMLTDNLRIALLHMRLLAELPFKVPALLRRRQTDRQYWFYRQERGSYSFIWLGTTILRTIGRRAFIVLFYPIITYFFLTSNSCRRASRSYQEKVYKTNKGKLALGRKPGFRSVFAHFVQFGEMIVDRVQAWSNAIPLEDLKWENVEPLLTLIKHKKGGLFVSAHFGSLEVVRTLSPSIPGLKVNALMLRSFTAKLGKIRDSTLNEERLIALEDFGPASLIKIKELVEKGEFVALLGDRVAVGTPGRTRQTTFFGEAACFPEGPWILAALLECPVFLVCCIRESSGLYRVYFEKFADRIILNRNKRDECLQECVVRYAGRLEHYCLKAPLQWFNFYDFWYQDGNLDRLAADNTLKETA